MEDLGNNSQAQPQETQGAPSPQPAQQQQVTPATPMEPTAWTASAQTEQASGSSFPAKKVIIIAVIALVALSLLGGGGYFFYSKSKKKVVNTPTTNNTGNNTYTPTTPTQTDYATLTIVWVKSVKKSGDVLEVAIGDGYSNAPAKIYKTTSSTEYYKRFDVDLENPDASKLYNGKVTKDEFYSLINAKLTKNAKNGGIMTTADLKKDMTITNIAVDS